MALLLLLPALAASCRDSSRAPTASTIICDVKVQEGSGGLAGAAAAGAVAGAGACTRGAGASWVGGEREAGSRTARTQPSGAPHLHRLAAWARGDASSAKAIPDQAPTAAFQ